MQIVSQTMDFPSGTGERNQRMTVVFNRPVVRCHVALGGYEAEYTNSDHHIKRITVMLSCQIGARTDEGFEVNVFVRFNLRDKNADDPFRGKVSFVVFAETQGIIPPIFEA